MRTSRRSIFALSLVTALVGVEAEARRDSPLSLIGMPSVLESSGHKVDRQIVRLGLGGDIDTGTVGVGTVAADAAMSTRRKKYASTRCSRLAMVRRDRNSRMKRKR